MIGRWIPSRGPGPESGIEAGAGTGEEEKGGIPSGEESSLAGGEVLFQPSFAFRVSGFTLLALRIQLFPLRRCPLCGHSSGLIYSQETAGRGSQCAEADRGAADASEL